MKNKINKDNMKILFALSALGASAVLASKGIKNLKNNLKPKTKFIELANNTDEQVYFIGGGLASLAGAAYLIRDCNFKGENIHILEGTKKLGGSNYATGDSEHGFISCGARMLNEETYENFWELFLSIPSLEYPNKSVTEEILNFDHLHPTNAQARLINKKGTILDAEKMEFNNVDRSYLFKLMSTPEEKLDDMTIEEWFEDTPHFFETNFWYMWQTTFAFQKWSSLFEFKRYIERMILEFPRLNTLEGVTHTPYNQYESIIMPLKAYLDSYGIDFNVNATVIDLDFDSGDDITVTGIHIKENNYVKMINLNKGDLCIMTSGCMTDNASLGDMNTPPEYNAIKPISGELWYKIARKRLFLGNPEPFFAHPDKTNWESFTVTCKGNNLLKMIEKFSSNIPGSGGLMTFKDSNWLMSIVVEAQPHFKNQSINTTVFWGYGLNTDRVGNYVEKEMRNCTGEEILIELIHHLHLEDKNDEIIQDVVNVIPCIMPYANAQFQPHKITDRPEVVPEGSTNFAMIGQFVEIPDDIVFTEEYSVRSARIAIYKLLKVKGKKVRQVTPYRKDAKIIVRALRTFFR